MADNEIVRVMLGEAALAAAKAAAAESKTEIRRRVDRCVLAFRAAFAVAEDMGDSESMGKALAGLNSICHAAIAAQLGRVETAASSAMAAAKSAGFAMA